MLWIRIRIRIGSGFNGDQKIAQINRKQLINYIFWSVLDVLFWRLKTCPVAWTSFRRIFLQFLILYKEKNFSCIFIQFLDSMGSLDPDSDSRSGSKRAKMALKNRKQLINFIFWSGGCSLLRAEDFSCSLDVLYGGPFCNFWFYKKKKMSNSWSSKLWIGIRIWNSLEILNLDLDQDSMNPDPQHWK